MMIKHIYKKSGKDYEYNKIRLTNLARMTNDGQLVVDIDLMKNPHPVTISLVSYGGIIGQDVIESGYIHVNNLNQKTLYWEDDWQNVRHNMILCVSYLNDPHSHFIAPELVKIGYNATKRFMSNSRKYLQRAKQISVPLGMQYKPSMTK